MDEERLRVQVSPARDLATVEFLETSGASGSLVLSADQILKLVQQLGAAHQAMTQGKKLPHLEGQQIETIFNTRWFVDPAMIGEAVALSFYHPAFGPLGFAIPIDQAEKMAKLLTNNVELAKAGRQKPQ
jgi:hypothetical protein